MATLEETLEKPHESSEKVAATNGDTVSKLEYSGLSEEGLDVSKTSISSTDIAQDFSADFEEHGAPASSAKAIKRDVNESHILSDDDCPKTLTTLETVKKSTKPKDAENVEICPIEAADEEEFEEEPILLEVYNEDEENKGGDIGDEPKAPELTVVRRERKQQFVVSKAKVHTPINHKSTSDKNVTPNRPIVTKSPGTIEIPRELITSDISVISPVIINHMKNMSGNEDDLIAILEGDGDHGSSTVDAATVEHYEFALPRSGGKQNDAGDKPHHHQLTAEQEREIAMEQIMSLPKKKKGRPKLNQAMKAARDSKLIKNNKTALVNSLVSEWDENEAKHDDATETEIVVEIRPQKKQAIVEPIQPTFRRSRIIKKKIIWDPDAPETAINYASLAHTSGAGPVKKQRKSFVRKSEEREENADAEIESTVQIPAPKKKKTSEIDKLLGDEGAANMLNSLNQGNNNNNKVDGTSPGKIPRAKPIKVEPSIVNSASTATAKGTKAIKSKEVKESSPQKQTPPTNANKKSVTPKSVGAGKKRGPKTSESWDYIYNDRPDDCMIIRRRSNSSYSSGASLNRTSIDLPNAPSLGDLDDHELETKPKRSRSNRNANFEFAKPKAKKVGKFESGASKSNFDEAKNSIVDANSIFGNHRANRTPIDDIDFEALPIKLENGNDKDISFVHISLCRFENFTQIILKPDNTFRSMRTVRFGVGFVYIFVCSVLY